MHLLRYYRRVRSAAQTTASAVDIANYTAALNAFSNKFGYLPIGSNDAVTAILAGNISGQFVFLHIPPKQVNTRGEFLDPLGTPYEIKVTTNQVRIQSR